MRDMEGEEDYYSKLMGLILGAHLGCVEGESGVVGH